MSLRDLPQDARPREKMLARGPAALSDSELLALILRTGVVGKYVLNLAQDMLAAHGGLRGLLNAPQAQLQSIKGMGAAKLSQLQAVLELTRRALAQELAQKPALQSPQAVRQYLQLHLQHKMFRGSLSQAQVYPREVATRALQLGAQALIVAHNHPSGSAAVSSADQQITTHLKQALALIDVRLLDHIIIAGTATHSMAEHGQL